MLWTHFFEMNTRVSSDKKQQPAGLYFFSSEAKKGSRNPGGDGSYWNHKDRMISVGEDRYVADCGVVGNADGGLVRNSDVGVVRNADGEDRDVADCCFVRHADGSVIRNAQGGDARNAIGDVVRTDDRGLFRNADGGHGEDRYVSDCCVVRQADGSVIRNAHGGDVRNAIGGDVRTYDRGLFRNAGVGLVLSNGGVARNGVHLCNADGGFDRITEGGVICADGRVFHHAAADVSPLHDPKKGRFISPSVGFVPKVVPEKMRFISPSSISPSDLFVRGTEKETRVSPSGFVRNTDRERRSSPSHPSGYCDGMNHHPEKDKYIFPSGSIVRKADGNFISAESSPVKVIRSEKQSDSPMHDSFPENGKNTRIPILPEIVDEIADEFLPRPEITTKLERQNFLQVLNNSGKYDHVLSSSIWNLVFIFEELVVPANASKTALTSLGKLSLERWQHASKIHVLFPSKQQLYLLRTAADTHYQVLLKDFVCKLEQFDGEIAVNFYSPTKNHSTDMLFVLNNDSAEKYVSRVSWGALLLNMKNDAENHAKACDIEDRIPKITSRQAEGNKFSYGTCHNNSISPVRDVNGNSRPNIKSETFHPVVIGSFVALSLAAEEIYPKWRPDKKYSDILPDEYIMKFAQKIHNDCLIPNNHVSITSVEKPCGCHDDDRTNSKKLEEVVCLSRVVVYDRVHLRFFKR